MEAQETAYTISEAAKYLGVTYHKVAYAVGKGWILAFQRNPVDLIWESELDRFKERELKKNEDSSEVLVSE